METIGRLAMLAASGAGLAQAMRRAGRRLAVLVALSVLVGLLGAGALGALGMALFYALILTMEPAWAALIVAVCFLVIAALIWLVARRWFLRAEPRPALDLAAAAPLAGLSELGIGRLLERNAVGVLLAAFVAGMLMSRRR